MSKQSDRISPQESSRTLATVAIVTPPDPSRPAVLFRKGAPPKAKRSVARSRFGRYLRGHQTPEGDIYVWQDHDPGVTPSDVLRIPAAFRPYTSAEFSGRWCEIPETAEPDHETDSATSRATLAATEPYRGHWFILQPSCHSSLAAYYRRKLPDFTITYRSAVQNLYARHKDDPTTSLPDDAPDFFQHPPDDGRAKVLPHDTPPPYKFHAYLRKDVRVYQLQTAFPDVEIRPDLVNPTERYVQLPRSITPTEYQAKFLANAVHHFTVNPAEPAPPSAVQQAHAHQALPSPCNPVFPYKAPDVLRTS